MGTGGPPYGGQTLIADTSAWTNIRKAAAPVNCVAEFTRALRNSQLCISPVVRLEMIWGARSGAEADQEEGIFLALRELPLTREIVTAAISGLRQMAGHSPGYQKVPIPDALIAATAQKHGYGVLMYDRHYPRLGSEFDVQAVWVAPQGSIT